MTDPILHKMSGDIGEIVGTLKAMEKRMDRDEAARGALYERIEKVEVDIGIVGQVAAQARDVADTAAETLKKEVVPQTNKIKALGLKGGGFLAGAAFIGGLGSAPLWSGLAAAIAKVTS